MAYSQKTESFFEDVWEVVKLVPQGRVTSYGAVAKYLGAARSARMVGWAMHACVGKYDVPAHRVLNRQGVLTGKVHFGTPGRMQELLEAEGVKVNNDKVVAWKELFWDPSVELAL